jgi:hypothetical protein
MDTPIQKFLTTAYTKDSHRRTKNATYTMPQVTLKQPFLRCGANMSIRDLMTGEIRSIRNAYLPKELIVIVIEYAVPIQCTFRTNSRCIHCSYDPAHDNVGNNSYLVIV